MKKKVFIAAMFFVTATSKAQDTTKLLNEVIVSANKFPNKTSLTGKVVTVITREQLEKSGSKNLSQILTEQVGLFINGANSNPGKDKSIYLRGAKVDHTLITIDGVPVYDPSGIGSNFDIRLLPVNNIEKIELLKGSQSTLYGSDAMAGVINITTRKTEKKPIVFSGFLSYGNYNTVQAGANISGSKNKFDYGIGYSLYKTDGFNEATDTVSTFQHETDKDGFTQQNISIQIGYKPTEKISIRPYLRYAKFNQSYDQGAFTDELDLTSTNTNIQTGIKNEFKIGKAMLNILYNYNNNDRQYVDDSVKSRNGYDIYSKGIYKGSEHYAEAFAFLPVNYFLRFTAGVDYRSSNSDQSYHSIGYFGPYDSELTSDSLKQHQTGVYSALVLNLKNGFNAELGGRLNNHSAYGNNFVYSFNPSYLLKNQWKFFGNISSAFKTPTLYQLYSEYGNKTLKPEKAFTIESGIQYYSKDNSFDGRITVYNRKTTDAIAFFFDPVTYASFYINQDKQNDHGVELESDFTIAKKLAVKLNYAFVDGNITTKNYDKDTTYFNLLRRPKSTFGLQLSGNIKKRFFAKVGVNYVGKRKDISYDASFNAVELTLKEYFLLNIYGEYSFAKSHCRAFAEILNATNTKYNEIYGFNTMGINASFGIRFSY